MPALSPQDEDQLWQEALKKGRPISFKVVSGSMAPTILPGDRILVEPLFSKTVPAIGDIVLMRQHDGWVVHRIIGRTGRREAPTELRQKGDAGHRAAPVSLANIAGVVARIDKDGVNGDGIDMHRARQRIINRLLGRFFQVQDRMLLALGGLGEEEAGSLTARIRRRGAWLALRCGGAVVRVAARLQF